MSAAVAPLLLPVAQLTGLVLMSQAGLNQQQELEDALTEELEALRVGDAHRSADPGESSASGNLIASINASGWQQMVEDTHIVTLQIKASPLSS